MLGLMNLWIVEQRIGFHQSASLFKCFEVILGFPPQFRLRTRNS